MSVELMEWLAGQAASVVNLQTKLTAAQAIGPENGGQGELHKALLIEQILNNIGLSFTRYDCLDERVESGRRPNIVAQVGNSAGRRLWLFAHMDVVPAGDLSAWKTDPFILSQNGDIVFGRGVEDNQQAIVSMLLLAEGISRLGIKTQFDLGLVFMADEESGSHFGLEWLLDQHGDIFSDSDAYIVPDGGSPGGDLIEIAEKAQLWLKFEVNGRQCHASMPQEGINSFVVASYLVLELVRCASRFDLNNPLFLPPLSTFVPTMHERNVEATNILPGKDVFYMDCRLLPGLDLQKVLRSFNEVLQKVGQKFNSDIKMEVIHWQPATFTDPHAEIVKMLSRSIQKITGHSARLIGIGGITVAGFLRKKGFPAVVWSTIRNSCHQPNEHSSILDTLQDAKIFGTLITEQ